MSLSYAKPAKRRPIVSHINSRTIVRAVYSDAKDLGENRNGTPPTEATNASEVDISDFRQLAIISQKRY